jgi:hypothetical protein
LALCDAENYSLRYIEAWEFEVDVVMGTTKRSFTAHTSMLWKDFEDKVLRQLDDTPKPVKLAYKIPGDKGKMSRLENYVDWDSALTRLCAKIKKARTLVGVEVKNTVSSHDLISKLGLTRDLEDKASVESIHRARKTKVRG